MSEVKPLSAEQLAKIRAWCTDMHARLVHYGVSCYDEGAIECDVVGLLATLDAERARADEAVALLRAVDAAWLIAFAITEAEMCAQSAPSRHWGEYKARADRYRALLPRLDALLGNDSRTSNGSTDE